MDKIALNKKQILLPIVALVLVVTMLMTPMTNARVTTTYVKNPVISSYGVTNPNGLTGSSAGSDYAIMDGYDSKVVGEWAISTALPSGAIVKFLGYKTTGNPKVTLYGSNSPTGSWTTLGYVDVTSTTEQWWTFSGSAGGYRYFAISNYNGGLNINHVIAQY